MDVERRAYTFTDEQNPWPKLSLSLSKSSSFLIFSFHMYIFISAFHTSIFNQGKSDFLLIEIFKGKVVHDLSLLICEYY